MLNGVIGENKNRFNYFSHSELQVCLEENVNFDMNLLLVLLGTGCKKLTWWNPG